MHTNGMSDVFTAKFDAEGKPVWARQGGGPGIDYCEGTIPDRRGAATRSAVYHEGGAFRRQWRGTARATSTSTWPHDDVKGNLADFLQQGGPGLDEAYCVARTGRNEAVLSGAYSGTCGHGTRTLTSAGSNDVVVLKVRLK